MKDLDDIARRKWQLIERTAFQRAAIARAVVGLERPIAVADRIVAGARFLRLHPVLLAVAAAALIAMRRRSLLGFAGPAFAAWRAWRTINVWAQRLGLEFPRRSRQKGGHVAP